MRKVYILLAKGSVRNFPDSNNKLLSSKAFLDKEKAIEYIDAFRDKCTNKDDLFALDKEGLKIDIIDLDLEE